MDVSGYEDRKIERVEVDHVDGASVTWTNGWSFAGVPEEHQDYLTPGAQFLLETRGFSQVTGLAKFNTNPDDVVCDIVWLWRKTNEELAQEHRALVADMNRRHEEQWEANQEEWAAREAALPSPLRRRLSRFRINGGHDFEIGGWGYELIISELAVLYAASGREETDEISEYAKREGTSGNQHNYAKALAGLLLEGKESEDAIANAPSGLGPLTGDADYSQSSLSD